MTDKIRINKNDLKEAVREVIAEAMDYGLSAVDFADYLTMDLPPEIEVVSKEGNDVSVTLTIQAQPLNGDVPFGSSQDVLLRDFIPTLFEVKITQRQLDHGTNEGGEY